MKNVLDRARQSVRIIYDSCLTDAAACPALLALFTHPDPIWREAMAMEGIEETDVRARMPKEAQS